MSGQSSFKQEYAAPQSFSSAVPRKHALDLLLSALLILGSTLFAALLFCRLNLIVPVLVPALSLLAASLTTAFWEREKEHELLLQEQIARAEQRYKDQQKQHQEELKRKETEARLQEIIKDRAQRQEFVQKLNHDLKAPVTVMNWILSRLLKGSLPQESVQEKIENLAKTSKRLVELLQELSESYNNSKIESSQELCNLKSILADCVAMANPLAEMKEQRLELHLYSNELRLKSSALNLSRIFDNLIRNAIVHNPNKTDIQIDCRSAAHVHQVIISDNGQGIESEVLKRLPLSSSKSRQDDASDSSQSTGSEFTGSALKALRLTAANLLSVSPPIEFLLFVRAKHRHLAGLPQLTLADLIAHL